MKETWLSLERQNYFEIDHSSFGGNDAVVCWCCKEPCFISTLPKQLKVQWNKLEYQVWLAMRTCLASNLVEKSSCSLTIMMSRRGWCSVKELVLQSAVPIFLHKQHDLSLNGKEHCSAMTSRLFVGNVLLVMTLTPTKLSANRQKNVPSCPNLKNLVLVVQVVVYFVCCFLVQDWHGKDAWWEVMGQLKNRRKTRQS